MANNNKILVLGAGKVAAPLVQHLLQNKYEVTVASELLYQADMVIQNHPLGEAVEWHSSSIEKLNSLVYQHQIVISLLPYSLHTIVCKACIKERRSLITTSYQQPEMESLHSDACKSNITILNEMGLDPGIDHMWAVKMIDEIKEQGGKIEKFISVCGALPAPECLDNPFRYKFSWSPIGVMRATSAKTSYLKNNQIIEQEGAKLMHDTYPLYLEGIGSFDAYGNRDSLKYKELYHLQEASTLFRGTLRYKGWCETMATLIDAGYFSEESLNNHDLSYAQLTSQLSKINHSENLRDEFARKHNIKTHSNGILSMEWLGLFSNNYYSQLAHTPLEVLTYRMVSKMKMLPSDKDMTLLNIKILYTLPDGKREIKDGVFHLMGKNNEDTAIAKTVSLPAAYAAELLLNKKIAHKGLAKPVHKEIYMPILNRLENEAEFQFLESIKKDSHWPEEW